MRVEMIKPHLLGAATVLLLLVAGVHAGKEVGFILIMVGLMSAVVTVLEYHTRKEKINSNG